MTKRVIACLVGFTLLLALRVAGQGFPKTATNWALPTGGLISTYGGTITDCGFNTLTLSGYGSVNTITGSQFWEILDINGDAKPDLVIPNQRQASGSLLPFGTAPNRYWKVHLGTGAGFAATPINWTLPTGGYLASYTGTAIDYGFNWVTSGLGGSQDVGSQTWSVLDLNGDAKPDLVVTSQLGSSLLPFGTAPNRYWKVYLNTGSGFATTALNWPLPTGGAVTSPYGIAIDYGFYWLTHFANGNEDVGSQNWSVADINGDTKPDLVVFSQMQANGNFLPFGTAPNRYWKVYLNTGNGFATAAINWPLPTGGQVYSYNGFTINYGFNALTSHKIGNEGGDSQTWSVRDINGDSMPDLVVLSHNIGNPVVFGTAANHYWKVYLGTGSGFATTSTDWALPDGGIVAYLGTYPTRDFGFNALTYSPGNYDDTGTQFWSVFDANGDAKPDLVVFSQKQANDSFLTFGTIPNRYWKVYLNNATPLGTTSTSNVADEVTLHPNPTSGQFTLSSPKSLLGQTYTLLDILGRTVRMGKFNVAEPTLNVQALPTGVYGVCLGTGSRILRFIKQ